jgi:hypothetical protein
MSFLQIKSFMGLHERIWQVRYEICQSQRETIHVRLEAIAIADKPYSMFMVFGWGHPITKSRAVAFVTLYNPMEVVPRVRPTALRDMEQDQTLHGPHQLRNQVCSFT